MTKNLLMFVVLGIFWTISVQSQSIDTVIQTPVFTSYFNKHLKEPVFVSYELYKGGGDCKRTGDVFHNSCNRIVTATPKDYSHSGFDEGHLCNSEDEAYDCDRQKGTFEFFNALPQTPNLNRGIWKKWETEIRKESQTKHLLIIAGGANYSQKGNLSVPAICWKIVENTQTKQIIHVLWCDNVPTDAQCHEVKTEVIYESVGDQAATEIENLIE